ncbi:unnamed protein product [Rotaria sp. Silwood1]|nr:unnamed protein product [Rotaria sp. Silwood1]
MAEAHEAVAFSFTVGHEGFNVDVSYDVFRALFYAAYRSWKLRCRRTLNSLYNSLYPGHPLRGIASCGFVAGLYFKGYDPSFQLIDWLESNVFRRYLQPHNGKILACIVVGGGAYIVFIQLRQYTLKKLFSYHGWMYQEHGKDIGLVPKVWSVLVKLCVGHNPSLFSCQNLLPSLPLPSLDETLQRYLRSVRPLYEDAEYQRMEKLAEEFKQTIGRKLQRYLWLKWLISTNYVSDWWEKFIYLRGRSPIMVNSNFYGLDAIYIRPTTIQTARAANLTCAAFRYRTELDHENIKPLMIQKFVPLCSSQYERQFNTIRIPGKEAEQISSSSHFLIELINNIRQSSKCEPERISSYVSQFITYLEPFIHHTINYVSYMTYRHEKILLLEQIKSLVETSLQLILSTKESGGNIKNLQWHKIVDNNSDLLIKLIFKLIHTFEEQSSLIGIMNGLCENIRKLISTLDTTKITHQGHFIDYQIRMIEILQQMMITIEQINTTDNIRHLANQLTRQYNELINITYGAIGTANTNDLSIHIKNIVQDLGLISIELIDKLGQHDSKNDLDILCKKIVEKISYVVTVLQGSVHGIQACINASSAVNNIINDLDATLLFAMSGTLNSEHVSETFFDHREAILKTAKVLVEDTKTLVAGAASSQEQLASAAQAAVRTITKLVAVVKSGALSLGSDNGEAQIMLINSVKDVAVALNNLINVTKSASGKNIVDPEMQKLKESAKVMVTNVTLLLRTVKTVEDKSQHGTHVLESTIESIAQELQIYNNEQVSSNRTTPEELVHVTKQITIATSKAVSAGQSCQQDDIISAVSYGRKSIIDLLIICKSTIYLTDDKNLQQRTLDNGRICVQNYKELLETIQILIQNPSNEIKQKLLNYSRIIMQSTQELVQCAEKFKGTNLIDLDDPSYKAENELLNAVQSIESAAKKLSTIKPRRKIKEIDENLSFDEQILEAAKSIMNATSELITAATSAQKELVDQGKLSSKSNSDAHGQWSQGLISAARYVASACHVLCDAANELVQGHGTKEKLISSAKQVSSNTAALLVACKVKADFMSQSMTRLQNTSNAVKRAADILVRTAQQAIDMQQEEKQIEVSTRLVSGIAQEIKCKEAILTKERELDEARNRLKAMRLAKYGHNEQDSNDST